MEILAILGSVVVFLPFNVSCFRLRRRLAVAFVGVALVALAFFLSDSPMKLFGPTFLTSALVLGWASWSWQVRIVGDMAMRKSDGLPPLVKTRRPSSVPYNPVFTARYLPRMLRDADSRRELREDAIDFDALFDRILRKISDDNSE